MSLLLNGTTGVSVDGGTSIVAAGSIGSTELSATGVTAGTYGSASAIPAITVDAKGRVTAVSTNAVSGGVSSLNGQTGAITDTTRGAIGSYHFEFTGLTLAIGSTTAGSNLTQLDSAGSIVNAGLSGTWRLMGTQPLPGSARQIYVRVS